MLVAKPIFFRKLTPGDVKHAIRQARRTPADTPMFYVMWDRVDELSHALARQQERAIVQKTMNDEERERQLETREYDV